MTVAWQSARRSLNVPKRDRPTLEVIPVFARNTHLTGWKPSAELAGSSKTITPATSLQYPVYVSQSSGRKLNHCGKHPKGGFYSRWFERGMDIFRRLSEETITVKLPQTLALAAFKKNYFWTRVSLMEGADTSWAVICNNPLSGLAFADWWTFCQLKALGQRLNRDVMLVGGLFKANAFLVYRHQLLSYRCRPIINQVSDWLWNKCSLLEQGISQIWLSNSFTGT